MDPIYYNFTEAYFRRVYLNGSRYNDHCYLWTQFKANETICPGGFIDGHCSLMSNRTDWGYSTGQSITASLILTPLSIAGALLNSLVILALVKTPSLSKEYLAPFIISLAVTDLAYSTLALPIAVAKHSMQYV